MFFRPTPRRFATAAAAAIALGLGAGAAYAQETPTAAPSEDDSDDATPTTSGVEPPKTQIGLGLRLRKVSIPEGLIEVFVGDVPGGISNTGVGAELSRRRGDFEVQFGVEYEKLTVTPGPWVEKGKSVMGGYVDDVRDDGFGWMTAELSFMYHTPIIDQVAVRYGGGAGIGVLFGDVRRTDQICLTNSLDSCVTDVTGENQDTPYDVPPVMLVINAIVGVQIRPTDALFINLEGGIRTIPFIGMTAGMYL